MSKSARTIQVAPETGCEWFEYQLGQGFALAKAALAADLLAQGSFETFVSRATRVEEIEFPRFPDVHGSESALAERLEDLTVQGAQSVLIEDDVQRKGDPHTESPSAFLGDRVLHWQQLRVGAGRVGADAIKEGAFGYPLNAFVVARSVEDLGLRDSEEAPSDLPQRVISTLMAIIVSAFDNTSFAIWTRNE